MRKVFILFFTLVSAAAVAQQHKLWYNKPASHWLEALPIGNSHLGAMVYGGTDVEQIQLNEETFWSGSPHDNNSPAAKAHLQEVRDSIFAGKEEVAHNIIDKNFFKGPHGMRFLPLGTIQLKLGHTDVSKYKRELTLNDALNTTSYTYKGVKYERTIFASQADNVIVVRLKAGKKGALTFNAAFDSPLESKVFPVSVSEKVYQITATVKNVEQEGIKGNLTAECRVEVKADGKISLDGKELKIADATEATLYIVAATNFVNYHDVSGNPTKKNNQMLTGIREMSYRQLLDRVISSLGFLQSIIK